MKGLIKWAAVGLMWACSYGFLAAAVTGGGHGNFIWLVTFLSGYFFGIFIPVMGFVGADLRPFWAKTTGVSLLALWLSFSILPVSGSDNGLIEDMARSWARSRLLFIVMSFLHLIPTTVFTVRLARSVIGNRT